MKQLGIGIFCVCSLYVSALLAIPSPSGVQCYFGTDVHFSWGESSGKVDGYRIYWGDAEGGPYLNRLCDVNGSKLRHTSSLDKKKLYHLICRAYNRVGESGDSNEVVWPSQ